MQPDPDILVVLTSARTEFEGSTIASTLEARGIPCKVFATAANTMQWEAAFTDPIKVMVRRADLAAAKDALQANKQDSVDIDWDEVDVGEADDRASDHDQYPRRSNSRGGLLVFLGWPLMGLAMIAVMGVAGLVIGSIILLIWLLFLAFSLVRRMQSRPAP